MTKETKTNGETAKADNTKDRPLKRASIPVKITNGNGETRTDWIDAGAVWATKDGENEVLVIKAVPVQYLGGMPDEIRIFLSPNKDRE